MNSLVFTAAGLVALAGKVEAFPSLYDTVHMGCTIPEMGFKGHTGVTPDPAIVMSVMKGTTAVTEYMPGEEYTIEVPALDGPIHAWIHSTAGEMSATTAAACPEAAFSAQPAPMQKFTWTAPATADPVTISVAIASAPTDPYYTATMDLAAGGGAGAPLAADAPMDADDELPITTALAEEPEDDMEAGNTEDPAVSGVATATGALAAAAAAVAALAM